jgi:hypothetical protein
MHDSRLIEDLRLLSPPDFRWVGWGAALGIVLLLAWRWWRGRLHRQQGLTSVATPDRLRAAWEEAMRALEALGARLDPEASRQYGIEVITVLRRYVEARFEVSAPRLTTLEFLAWVQGLKVPPVDRDQSLERFLAGCDWMKFGRARATGEELRAMHALAVAFVVETRPVGSGIGSDVGVEAAARGAASALGGPG